MTTSWNRAKPDRRDFILTALEASRGDAQDVAGVADRLTSYIARSAALPFDEDHNQRLKEYLVALIESSRGSDSLTQTAETLLDLITDAENGDVAFYRKIQE